MAFNPEEQYFIQSSNSNLLEFHRYADAYVTRPPYQRKSVWSIKKQQALMDSILRRYYVPTLVLRQVRLDQDNVRKEVIDGQQRITTIQNFYNNKFKLPKSLNDLGSDLAGKRYSELDSEKRRFIDDLQIKIDLIRSIEEKSNTQHQQIATEIFRRLQEGESLNSMEVAHARLSSRVRNFLVKHSDDITFDYKNYKPIDENKSKHPFFKAIQRANNRMEHLALLARMLLIEETKDYPDLKDTSIRELIDKTICPDGIGDFSYEKEKSPKRVLKTLNLFFKIIKEDPILQSGDKIKELKREYFILSFYTLIRHINKNYVIDEKILNSLYTFLVEFHNRWRANDPEDTDIARFSSYRQQGSVDLRERDIILRHNYFNYLTEQNLSIQSKDKRRAFNEAERIQIYRRYKGMCQHCLDEGKVEKEALVPWKDFQADHILAWIKGGKTKLDNSQLLCSHHNQSKGSK